MSRAASRLISFRSNAALQNLIQRHLLRPSAAAVSDASVAQLVNTLPEPQMTSHFSAENPKPYYNTLFFQKPRCNAGEIMKKYSSNANDGRFPLGMFGLSGFDQSEILKIHTRRPDPSDNSDYSDGYFKNTDIGVFEDDDYDVDDAFGDDSDDGDSDGDDFDRDEKIRE